jgi:predicted negative regulator of RcsB-dependent stress response
MKRTERHHLKDNELAKVAASAQRVVEQRQGLITGLVVGVVVVSASILGYMTWQNRVIAGADAALAEALTVAEARIGPAPAAGSKGSGGLSFETARARNQAALTKFKVVADEYPGTESGIFARYRQAATYMALGEPASAATTYQQVVDRADNKLYGQMARLGLAEAQAQTGQYEQAIATFKLLADRKDAAVPIDGVLIRLGRAYLDAGKPADAEQTFNKLVQEFPDSPFSGDARRELNQLKKT